MSVCPPLRRSDPCRAGGRDAARGRPATRDPSSSDVNRRSGDCEAEDGVDADADAACRSSRHGTVEG